MLLIIIPLGMIVLGLLGNVVFEVFEYYDVSTCFRIMLIFGVIAFVFCSLVMLFARIETSAEIADFLSVKRSVVCAMRNKGEIENAALQLKIVEANQWLGKNKAYRRSKWVNWFIPSAIDTLQFIQLPNK